MGSDDEEGSTTHAAQEHHEAPRHEDLPTNYEEGLDFVEHHTEAVTNEHGHLDSAEDHLIKSEDEETDHSGAPESAPAKKLKLSVSKEHPITDETHGMMEQTYIDLGMGPPVGNPNSHHDSGEGKNKRYALESHGEDPHSALVSHVRAEPSEEPATNFHDNPKPHHAEVNVEAVTDISAAEPPSHSHSTETHSPAEVTLHASEEIHPSPTHHEPAPVEVHHPIVQNHSSKPESHSISDVHTTESAHHSSNSHPVAVPSHGAHSAEVDEFPFPHSAEKTYGELAERLHDGTFELIKAEMRDDAEKTTQAINEMTNRLQAIIDRSSHPKSPQPSQAVEDAARAMAIHMDRLSFAQYQENTQKVSILVGKVATMVRELETVMESAEDHGDSNSHEMQSHSPHEQEPSGHGH